MSEERLVPKLRFSGFDDEWIIKKLNDVSDVNPKTRELPEKFVYIDLDSVNHGILTKFNQITKNEAPSRAQRCLNVNDILFQTVRPYQMNNLFFELYDGEYVASTGYAQIKSKIVPKFLYYYLHYNKFVNEVLNRCTGTSYPAINSNDLKKIKIKIPSSSNEQRLIGDLFYKLDQKIELLKDKYNYYQDFKKFLMQQIFTQKLRFDKTSEWETFALNDIGKTYNGLSGLSKDNFEKGNSKYITYKSIFDNNILKSDFTENVDLNNKSQNEVKKGDLFFTGSSETPEEVGMVSVLSSTVEDCYLNSFCFGFRLNNNYDVNPLFLAYYLRSPIMRNKIMILAQGSTRFNLSKKEILKLKVEIPSISEQQQIIDLFQNVDNKINEISIQTDNFNKFKKGLLQQMFDNILLFKL